MTLQELGIVLDTYVDVRWSEPNNRFHVSLARVEQVDGGILRSLYGVGSTRDEAMHDYAKQLGGKRLAVNAMREDRKEITAPPTIDPE